MAIEKVSATGSEMLTGVIYGTLGELPGRPPNDRDYDVIAKTLSKVAKEAKQHGVRLGIEPVNRYETFLVNTVEQGVSLVERIGADNVFLHPDTYHMNIEEDSFAEALRTGGSHVQYIHLSESHRGTPGHGTVDWDSVFEGLRDISFQGGLVMESFAEINEDIARATCMWRDIVKDPARLVQDGLAFLQSKADAYGLK
jgi:D-psicose/D-tagatose/L-ribulose 3-epimerase